MPLSEQSGLEANNVMIGIVLGLLSFFLVVLYPYSKPSKKALPGRDATTMIMLVNLYIF